MRQRIFTGIEPELRANTLTIVSVDNIDILQTHAMVSSLDATRSWHGIPVQCVQPIPLAGTLSEADVHVGQTLSRKHGAGSPTGSSRPTEKHKRRR